MKTIGITDNRELEVISVYAATNARIAAAPTPAWYVVGAFFLPIGAPGRFELIGLVSDPSSALHARLFDVTDAKPVSGSEVVIDGDLVDTRVISDLIEFDGSHIYQVQLEVLGTTGFGLLKNATLI